MSNKSQIKQRRNFIVNRAKILANKSLIKFIIIWLNVPMGFCPLGYYYIKFLNSANLFHSSHTIDVALYFCF